MVSFASYHVLFAHRTHSREKEGARPRVYIRSEQALLISDGEGGTAMSCCDF